MSLIDRYLARTFLYTLGFALLAFVLVFVIVDLIENLDSKVFGDM